MKTICIDMIRHGQTPGNARKCYIGVTNEPLDSRGREQAAALSRQLGIVSGRSERNGKAEAENRVLWIVSPMLRCIQTAALLLNESPDEDDWPEGIHFRQCPGMSYRADP